MAHPPGPDGVNERCDDKEQTPKDPSVAAQRPSENVQQLGTMQLPIRAATHEAIRSPLSDVGAPPPRALTTDVLPFPKLSSPSTLPLHHPISVDLSTGMSPEEAQGYLLRIGLPDIEQWMQKVTGVSPNIDRLPVRIGTLQNSAEGNVSVITSVAHLLKRVSDGYLRLTPSQYRGLHQLQIDASCLRGGRINYAVLCHECGHLWTQRLLSAHPSSYAFSEGFAELFRSAAALWSGKPWESAIGCNGFEVLHGPKVPQLISAHEQHLPPTLAVAARSIVCNRLIHHLGGLSCSKLAAISRACTVQAPTPVLPFGNILEEMERELGMPGFAKSCMDDPLLAFGNLQTGTTALAFPNATGECMDLTCFDVTDADPHYFRSRSAHPSSVKTMDFTNENFHLQGVQVSHPKYSIGINHSGGSYAVNVSLQGPITISPRQVLAWVRAQGSQCPTGEFHIVFTLPGHSARTLQRTIIITDELKAKVANS